MHIHVLSRYLPTPLPCIIDARRPGGSSSGSGSTLTIVIIIAVVVIIAVIAFVVLDKKKKKAAATAAADARSFANPMYANADQQGKPAKRAQPAEVTQFEVPDSGETNTEGGYMDVNADDNEDY